MNIYLISSVYPSKYEPKGTTPVVHYFAKEWVKNGNTVHVVHVKKVYPNFFYFIGRLFGKKLYSILGYPIPEHHPKEYSEILEGVSIDHITLKKIIPHKRFSLKQLSLGLEKIVRSIEENEVPDCFVGHWDNPQLELLISLKEKYQRPICLVFHDSEFSTIKKRYRKRSEEMLGKLDLIGFRSNAAKINFKKIFPAHYNNFVAASGISSDFIVAGSNAIRGCIKISNFIYVGALIKRKNPINVLGAILRAYDNENFILTYIGEGSEKTAISNRFSQVNNRGELHFLGRIPRKEIITYLLRSDVFIMISKNEVFGLVYLEAMALGCITIASRNEGMDGIIKDGENGFLCESGNEEELASILCRIKQMSPIKLKEISDRARETALEYSDEKCALKYVNNLKSMVNVTVSSL